MRSASEVTARTAIRDAALRLFAERGIDGVSVRQIAAAAEVSPALVLHHFGSKEGLRAEVDRFVVSYVERFAGDFTPEDVDRVMSGDTESTSSALSAAFPPDSPELAYVPRLLLEGGEAGRELFRHWHAFTLRTLREWEQAGVIATGPDPEARAAFMLTADLGLMVLRDMVAETIGVDPLGDGVARWTDEVVRIYGGLLIQGGTPADDERGGEHDD